MPVIDYPGGGSALEFIATIDKLLTLDFDTMIPGHGRIMTKDEVRAYRTRFQTMNQRMRALIRKGVTKDQLKTLDQARAQLQARRPWLGQLRQHDDMVRRHGGVLRRDRRSFTVVCTSCAR